MPDIYVSPKKPKKQPKSRLKQALTDAGIKTGLNSLGALVALPEDIKFETQEKEEKIILLLRRHWITNVFWLLTVFSMTLMPLIFAVWPVLHSLPVRYRIVTMIIWYLLILGLALEKFLCWFFNVFIITDERVIDVDFISLVYRQISQAKIDRIEDMTFKTGGLFQSIFNFGSVYIQTAGEEFWDDIRKELISKCVR